MPRRSLYPGHLAFDAVKNSSGADHLCRRTLWHAGAAHCLCGCCLPGCQLRDELLEETKTCQIFRHRKAVARTSFAAAAGENPVADRELLLGLAGIPENPRLRLAL